jgi:hypothetical protein
MKDRGIVLKIEFYYTDRYISEGYPGKDPSEPSEPMTDRDLKAFATDKFIAEITRLSELGDLRSYVESSIYSNASAISQNTHTFS